MDIENELLTCVEQELNSDGLTDGYTICNELSRGENGVVYSLHTTTVSNNETKFVLKVIPFDLHISEENNRIQIEREYKFGYQVGEIGLGAKYISYGFCRCEFIKKPTVNEYINRDIDSSDPNYEDYTDYADEINGDLIGHIGWIIMSYLPGVTLDKVQLHQPWMLIKSLDALYVLATRYNIAQLDYGPHNIIIDYKPCNLDLSSSGMESIRHTSRMGCSPGEFSIKNVYIIDFGLSSTFIEKKENIISDIYSDISSIYTDTQLQILALREYMFNIIKELTFIKFNNINTLIEWTDIANKWYSYIFRVPEGHHVINWDTRSHIANDKLYQRWRERQGEKINVSNQTW